MTSKQAPIRSAFDATNTAAETLDGVELSGKTAIVTGGYSGLGLETTRALAMAGATVIVPARNAAKARAALDGIERVEHATVDLLDAASIDAFARSFIDSGRPLHILVNSAGIMASPLTRDARGYESQFSANHLGHFHLTNRLGPALRDANGARVVSVSSRAHRFAQVDFADLQFERRPYDKWLSYSQSKTANALFAVALDRRGEPYGVRAFSVHPGSIITDLSRFLSDEELKAVGVSRHEPERLPVGKSVEEGGDFRTVAQGAATAVWCATSVELEGVGGVYCENINIARMASADDQFQKGVRDWAIDPDVAERLWEMSAKLTGVNIF
jgi:NAD(P)-dependent dehydrogenase (short-subunit alcohol dehydrogenase family)